MVACGAPEPVRSTPTAPTVDLGGDRKQEIVWTDLAEVFPTRPCALPGPLAGLVPGMGGAAAREVLDAARQPGVRVMGEPRGDAMVFSTLFAGHPTLGITLVLDADGAALREVQLSVPSEVAQPMLTARWGPADEVEFRPEGRSVHRWREPGATWVVELLPIEGDRHVVRYHAG